MRKKRLSYIYVSAHILIWVLLFLLPFALPPYDSVRLNTRFIVYWATWVLERAGIFYIFYIYVIRRHLKPGSFLKFIGVSLIIYILYIGFEIAINYPISLFTYPKDKFDITSKIFSSMFVNAFFIAFALFISMLESWFTAQRYRQEVERERLESELKMLRFQVNPHFLFNTLNNIHTLVYKKSDKAPEAVLKLSSLMRYMLYEADGERVSLSKELEYLDNFVELQKLRFNSSRQVTMKIDGEPEGYEIAPLLLIPFIENAFKHGTRSSKATTIDISISIHNGKLTFICQNDTFPESGSDINSGIGLANVRKRLDLMYSGHYQLDIDKSDHKYYVTLIISL